MTGNTRPTLLAVGSGLPSTGYGRVITSLLPAINDVFHTLHFAVDVAREPPELPWTVEPNRLAGDRGGREQLPGLLARHRPNVVWICHDWWVWLLNAPALRAQRPPPAVVVYSPVDASTLAPRDADGLHALVLYTEHARRGIQNALSRTPDPPVLYVVPHGVDTAVFAPLGDHATPPAMRQSRRMIRTRILPDRPELADGFVVLNSNRNIIRKRIDLTLAGFARLAREHEDAYLILHMGLTDQGIDVLKTAYALGIADRVMTTTNGTGHPNVTDREMNEIYNAADVGVNTATREGWGLTATEHAAAGGALVIADLPTTREIWADTATFIPDRPDPFSGRALDPEALAAALARLHASSEQRWNRAIAARRRSSQPDWSWAAIAQRWTELLRSAAATSRTER